MALVFVCPLLRAQDGLGGALSDQRAAQAVLLGALGQSLVAADFDRDERPDGAVLTCAGEFKGRKLFRIHLHLTAGQDHELTFDSSETEIALATPDVNRDGIPDLVVEQAFTRKRLRVWLNDGHGVFRPVRAEDFPPSTEAPHTWKLPFEREAAAVVLLPSRNGNDHALQILEILRTGSSSSNWRQRSQSRALQAGSIAFPSPRSPPALLPL